ncbi:MAG: hypothetical protein ACXWLZ_02115 [Rhizomicrobium sp.]
MFVYRVKVEELTEQSLSLLKLDLYQGEKTLREHCPIREMSVVADDGAHKGELDIYLALDDFINGSQVRRLMGELLTMIDHGSVAAEAPEPRVSTELINI